MGQAASFFGVSQLVFQRLAVHPQDFAYATDAIAFETLDKTFEGLRYVLSKGRKPAVIEFVDRIFYPRNFIGEEVTYESLDFDNLPDNFDSEGSAIYYNGPVKVKNISTFLTTITEKEFATLFDPDELNQAGIYPRAWSRATAKDNAFNERSIVQEFSSLKRFFERLAEEYAYCLVFVG